MSLDVDVPDPPELETVGDVDGGNADGGDAVELDVDDGGDDYRRGEIEAFLTEGAWADAFDEWAAHTDLDEEEYGIVCDLGLIDGFDFFWDDFVSRVGYHTPGIPEDWREREIHPDLDAWETVSSINAALAELGRVTSAILTEEHADWGTDDAIGEELPDFE